MQRASNGPNLMMQLPRWTCRYGVRQRAHLMQANCLTTAARLTGQIGRRILHSYRSSSQTIAMANRERANRSVVSRRRSLRQRGAV